MVMDKIQGIVLRVEKRHVMVVTEDGDFIRIQMPVHKPLPGDKIEVPIKRNKVFRPYMIAAVILMFFIGFGIFKPLMIPQAYATVSLDMTPSMELTVNKDNLVMSAKAQNDEGNALLKELDIKGLDIYHAVNLITSKAIEMGFFTSESKNLALATVVPLLNEDSKNNIDNDKLMKVIHNEMFARKYDGYVVVNQVNSATRNQALESGLSVPRYLMMEKSKEQGITVTPEMLMSKSPTELMMETDFQIQTAFPDDWCNIYEQNWNMNTPMNNQQNCINPLDNSIQDNLNNEDYIKGKSTPSPTPRNNLMNSPWPNNCD